MRLFFAMTLLLSICFCDVYAQPTEVKMKKLDGYYYSGGEGLLKPGVNCFVLQKAKDFEKLFGKYRTDTPNFSKDMMLVVVMPATKKDIKMEFNRVSMKAGSFVEVYCNLNKLKGKNLTYEANPIIVCTIPKSKGIKTVKFYEEMPKSELRLMQAVELKEEKGTLN